MRMLLENLGFSILGAVAFHRVLVRRKMPAVTSLTSLKVDEEWGTLKMKNLAEQLRLYKAPNDEEDEEGFREIASSVGVPECKVLGVTPTKKAAVLICLFEGCHGELRVILTKRAKSLSSHSGEVALPGGKRDEEDVDDAATALREAHEEIGLEPSSVKVVASLETFLSKHLFRVVPVIAILPNKHHFKPQCNEAEVESIFDAPLEMFLKKEKHRSEQHEWLGSEYLLHYYDYDFKGDKYVIWGLTAAILIRAASLVYQNPPDFDEFSPCFASIRNKYLLRSSA